ncbi:uncharacterized protein J3D65DRAFT_669901 [Phyllosticta citribraziliensis]|uniref:Uncharacterized protein n=1 Tax=Phyllosticta citribraziliensis TaxID=989973 RepID=A0ABR1LG80_9PEZI
MPVASQIKLLENVTTPKGAKIFSWDNDGHKNSNDLRRFLSNVDKRVSDELCVYHEHNHSLNDELDGKIETMVFSTVQQAIACNPRIRKEIVSLRKDSQYKLTWYPTPMNCAGDRDVANFLSLTTLLAQGHFSRCVQAMVQLQGARRIQTLPGFHQRIEEWKETQVSESKRPHEFYDDVFPDETRNPSTHIGTGDALFFHSCSPWAFQQHSSGDCMHLVLLAITDQERGTLEDSNVAPKLPTLGLNCARSSSTPSGTCRGDKTTPSELQPSWIEKQAQSENIGPEMRHRLLTMARTTLRNHSTGLCG